MLIVNRCSFQAPPLRRVSPQSGAAPGGSGWTAEISDHSSSQRTNTGFRESDALRWLFETVVQQCIAGGLARADRFAIDASRHDGNERTLVDRI
jgi:hypothetical protein